MHLQQKGFSFLENNNIENEVVRIKTYQVPHLYQFHILQQNHDGNPVWLLQLLERKLHNTKSKNMRKIMALALYMKTTFKEQSPQMYYLLI